MKLEACAVTVRHGSLVALDGVSLDFPVGSRTLVTGAASSGKTTLLKCLVGLQRCSEGLVTWDGVNLATLAPRERRAAQGRLGMIFQSDALFDSDTVLDNVKLPLLRRGATEADAHRRALATLERVGLSEVAEQRPEALSGGMRKRVGIARAVAPSPEVLVADDPFAGLDPRTEASVARLLLEVTEGRTLIVALPDPVTSLPLTRQVELLEGRVDPEVTRC